MQFRSKQQLIFLLGNDMCRHMEELRITNEVPFSSLRRRLSPTDKVLYPEASHYLGCPGGSGLDAYRSEKG